MNCTASTLSVNRRQFVESTTSLATPKKRRLWPKIATGILLLFVLTRACELEDWRQWADIDTLSAAYAEAGDFASATRYARQALELTPLDDPRRDEVAAHLKLFEEKKPVRE